MDGSDVAKVHGVTAVGRCSLLYAHPYLNALAGKKGYESCKGGVYLSGIKLEETFVKTDQSMDNAKLVTFLNGDTMTLTNSCRSGTITIAATRVGTSIPDGNAVVLFDFIRSQGDATGGTLKVSWHMSDVNGVDKSRSVTFQTVCVQKVEQLQLAGNDVPTYSIVLTYADVNDGDYPKI